MHRGFLYRFTSWLAFVIGIALAGFHAPLLGSAFEDIDGPEAVVNSDIIVPSQIRDFCYEKDRTARRELKDGDVMVKIRENHLAALHELIDRLLILQEFRKKGSPVSEDLVDQRIAAIIREEYGGDREEFLRKLKARESSLDRFRQNERDNVIVTEMRREVIAGKIKISAAQIADYYRRYDASGKSLSEVHDEIEKTLAQNESRRLQEEWIEKLKKAAYIKKLRQ